MNDTICVSRSIVSHWLWEDPEKLKWWLDLLIMAADEDTDTIHDSHRVSLKRGELIASAPFLAKRWKRERKTIFHFLQMLENDGMIKRRTLNRFTVIITISDYKTDSQTDCLTARKADSLKGGSTNCKRGTSKQTKQPQTDCLTDCLTAQNTDCLTDCLIKKPRRDKPNDVQEVRDYVQEKGYHFNPDEFYAFYESSNWHRGKTKITNWKQCCVTWETTWKKGRNDYEEANKKILEDNPPMGKGSYGAVIHYIADHSENIVKCVPLPTEAEVAEISQNYKDFFIQAVKNMDADPNLSKKTFWGAFVNAIQLTKRTIDYGTQQLAKEESARNKRDEQLRAFQAARDNTPDSGAFFGDY